MLQKRVLMKEKIDKLLSEQSGTTTPFMKVGYIPHSSMKVSFNAHNPIREQLECLASKVYNMSIQKENNRPLKAQIYQKRGNILATEIEIDHSVETKTKL